MAQKQYFGIDCQGGFYIQSVINLPAWQSSYERRIVLNLADGYLYYGGLTGWQKLVMFPSSGLLNVQVFTASGTYYPTAMTNSIIVEAVGGGGSGGGGSGTTSNQVSAAGGGAAGAYGLSRYISGFTGGIPVTVGAGGAPINGAGGNYGGTTSFGTLLTCPGGAASPVGPAGITTSMNASSDCGQNYGALPSGANLKALSGDDGDRALIMFPYALSSGKGGSSLLGTGGSSAQGSENACPGQGYGSGGGGSVSQISSGTKAGGAGAPGIVIVYEYE